MKFFKKLLLSLAIILGLAILALYLFDADYILRGVKITYLKGYKTAYIDDYSEFDNRKIKNSEKPQPWTLHKKYNSAEATQKLQSINEELGTVAFLIIKNDSIWYEKYADDYGKKSHTNSFSMAKSITSALLGKAIKDGFIKSLDQPVADFYPQFDKRLTVGDLSSMSSGLNWEENYYSPFSMTARAYLDDDIKELILSLKVEEEPGKAYKYLSGNTQLLSMVIAKASEKTLSDYAKRKKFDGIICGHIHHAEDRDFNGVNYLNCGDWVESCTALAENYDGSFEILYWDKIREQYLDDKEIIKPIKTEELKKAS